MQEPKGVRLPIGFKWQQPLFISRNTIILMLLIIASSAFLSSGFAIIRWSHSLSSTVAINGANRWDGDKKATIPTFDFSPPGAQKLSVSLIFAHYYSSHSGAKSLGAPVTVAIPTDQGWIQFFESGALLLPAAQQKHTPDAQGSLIELHDSGARDPNTGIMRLPLLQALLSAGSQVPVGGVGSRLSYVDLRNATDPNLMVMAPTAGHTATLSPVGSQKFFIKAGIRAGEDVGHLVPLPFWSYINRADISPDGWEVDFGAPLTEALSFTITKNGSVHQMLVQVFWRDGLVLDQGTLDASGQPLIQRLDTGVAYLRTLGPPSVALSAAQTIWAQGNTVLLDAPSTGQTIARVGQSFPLTLLGDTTWSAGMLWYHVRWTAPKRTGSGWVSAAAITFTSPGKVPAWASIDVLSPSLAAYLANIGNNVDAVVYDVTHQRYYTYNANAQFLTGSSIKVAIMLTFLDMIEREHRQPSAREMHLLTTMIENSNNDSAGILYESEIGSAAGVARYLRKINITGLNPIPVDFGWSLITPLAMVDMLTDLYEGTILTAHDRNLALYLMEHIEYDQQVGVGDTAPEGATVAMKDGWVPGPDNLWDMNSSGIVTLGQETYIIAVYTHDQHLLGDGQAIARHVCSSVASLLT